MAWAGAPATREVTVSRATEASEASASPRKPKVWMSSRSSPVDLGRGVAGERQRQFVRRDAAAVVGHADQRLAAVGHGDLDPRGPGVERVLHQLLHGRGRALHHLSRRDAVDRGLVQRANRPTVVGYVGVRKGHATISSMAALDSTGRQFVASTPSG
jgi:hypothetical protein